MRGERERDERQIFQAACAYTTTYRFHDVVRDVDWARVLAGFHFRNSDQEGSALGRDVGRYVTDHLVQTAWLKRPGRRLR